MTRISPSGLNIYIFYILIQGLGTRECYQTACSHEFSIPVGSGQSAHRRTAFWPHCSLPCTIIQAVGAVILFPIPPCTPVLGAVTMQLESRIAVQSAASSTSILKSGAGVRLQGSGPTRLSPCFDRQSQHVAGENVGLKRW